MAYVRRIPDKGYYSQILKRQKATPTMFYINALCSENPNVKSYVKEPLSKMVSTLRAKLESNFWNKRYRNKTQALIEGTH